MDGDAFFVAVEVAKNPTLKGLPVVTGQERGIVTALSYEAKALGVSRGLPIFQLKKLFPSVIVLPGDYASYVNYSERMFSIVRRYTDDVEEYSIDECFADLTGWDIPLQMSYKQIAEKIQKEIQDELHISVSVGLAPTKVLAKIASKHMKPHGLTVIEQESISRFLLKTPIHNIWGIGPQTSQYLVKHGVLTGQDLVSKDESWVDHMLSKPYKQIWKELRGLSVSPVDPDTKDDYASIQKTKTFYPPTLDPVFLFSELSKHMEDACAKARHYHLAPRSVSFFLKTQTFRYHRSHVKFLSPNNIPEMILPRIQKDFAHIHSKIKKQGILIRTTGVTLHDLVDTRVTQGDLFGEDQHVKKLNSIHKQIDSLEHKFGKRVVYLASTQKAIHKKKDGATDADTEDRNLLFL